MWHYGRILPSQRLLSTSLEMGVTSASVIWVMAGIGILVGFERYLAAILLSFLTVGILRGVTLLETTFTALSKGVYSRLITHKKKKPHQED